MIVNKLVTPFSLICPMFEKKMEGTQATAFKLKKNWGQLECMIWKHLCALNLIFSDLLHGNTTHPAGILWRVARVSLGQSIIFTEDENGQCSVGNFGDLNYHVRTKCYWNVRCVASLAGWPDSKAQGRTLLEHWSYVWCVRTYKKHRIKPRSDK